MAGAARLTVLAAAGRLGCTLPRGIIMKTLLKITAFAAVMVAGLPAANGALAGPAQDALSACLTQKTTAADHVVLADWVFSIIALHPSVANMSAVTPAQREDLNKKAGALYTRLLTTDCGAELKTAVKTEGTNAVEAAFSTLGATAMQDLMADPNVQAGASDLSKYVDQDKINAELTGN